GKYKEARFVYWHIIDRDPKNAEAVSRLGLLTATALKSPGPAAQLLAQAVALQPNSAIYQANLGEALRLVGRFNEALLALQASLRINPNDPNVLSNAGLTLGQLGRSEEGLAACRAAVGMNPRFP